MIPSGEQIVLSHGAQRAVVVEVGGGLRAYALGDWEVLDGYAEDERCTGARGQPLIPWPNRLRDGRYTFEGTQHQLALTEPSKHNAIHGLVRWANWTVASRAEARVTVHHVLHPQSGWPFALDLAITYELSSEGLKVSTAATNVGATACPYGAGAHPYLSLGTERIDPLVVQAPGQSHMPSDARGLPMASEPVTGTQFDFLRARELGDTQLDTCYADLRRDEDGRARVRVATPDARRSVTLWLDESYQYLMLFTGDSLPEPDRRRRGLGIEPMTCAPNGLQSGDGLRILAPGASFISTWGIVPGPERPVRDHNVGAATSDA